MFLRLLSFGVLAAFLVACTPDSASRTDKVDPRVPEAKVTSENYLSGRAFCETYREPRPEMNFKGIGAEIGKRVDVPRDYADPSRGTWSIYTWMRKEFDPKKPTLIYIEGGPGGNSHLDAQFSAGEFNEIYFDQRGMGCSAPETYAEYQDPQWYSTQNTVLDMEQIRKAYGLESWSVFGASYGTVPATIYGSQYPNVTTGVVLDGTEYDGFSEEEGKFTADKANLVLDTLTGPEREAFNRFMGSDSPGVDAVYDVIDGIKYYDNGFQELQRAMKESLSKGTFDPSRFLSYKTRKENQERGWGRPQAPGNVDENLLMKIDCRELSIMKRFKAIRYYSTYLGKFTTWDYSSDSRVKDVCAGYGVDPARFKAYTARDYPLDVPVTYFQGALDGATLASGAIKHWRNVPRGKKAFFLKKRGGHCPNALSLWSEAAAIRTEQEALFRGALLGLDFTATSANLVNSSLPAEQQWKIYLDPNAPARPEDELGGI